MRTVGQLKDKIKKFTCIEEESFISDDELCCFIDMAQKRAIELISCLNKDYFTSCVDMEIESKTNTVDLPSDIRGTKIKRVMWVDGKCCTPLEREPYICQVDKCATRPCAYTFFNKKDVGPQLTLFPTPSKEGTVRIIYERQPCDIDENTDGSQEFELQEICKYVFDFVKLRIYEKEKNPLASLAISELNESERLMIECLSTQFTDSCDVEPDQCGRAYLEGGSGGYGGGYGGYGGGW